MIAIVLFIFLIIWILLTKFAMKIGRYLFRRFRPDNPRVERWGAFWGFMLRWAGCWFIGRWKRSLSAFMRHKCASRRGLRFM